MNSKRRGRSPCGLPLICAQLSMCSLSWCSLVTYLSATRQTSHPTTYAFWKHFCSSRMVGYEVWLFLLKFFVCKSFSLRFFSRKFFSEIFIQNFFFGIFSLTFFLRKFFFRKFFFGNLSSKFFLRNFILSNKEIIFSTVFYIYIWYQVYLFSRQLDLDGRTSLEGILQITNTNP